MRSETLILEQDSEETQLSVEDLRVTLTRLLGEFAAPTTRASRSQGKSTGGEVISKESRRSSSKGDSLSKVKRARCEMRVKHPYDRACEGQNVKFMGPNMDGGSLTQTDNGNMFDRRMAMNYPFDGRTRAEE